MREKGKGKGPCAEASKGGKEGREGREEEKIERKGRENVYKYP